MPTGVFGEQNVASHHDLFGGGRNSLQAKPGRNDALMHGSAGRQGRVFAVIGNRYAEGAGILERGTHQVAGNNRLSVIAHRNSAGAYELSKFRELLPLLTQRNSAYGVHSRP